MYIAVNNFPILQLVSFRSFSNVVVAVVVFLVAADDGSGDGDAVVSSSILKC